MDVRPDRCLSVLSERGLLPQRRAAVYLAGSLVRGWGNPTSDLDVYVVGPDRWEGDRANETPVSVAPGSVPVAAFYVDGRRWDVEYWLESQVDELIDHVSWDAFESERVSPESLTKCEIAFAQRLPFSLVVEGHDWVKRRTADVDASAIKTMLASKALYQLDLLSEDALGMVEAGDLTSAMLAARYALGYAVEALLCSYGEFNEQDKWRARRLQSVAPPELDFEEYWELETMRSYDPAEPGVWVEETLRMCQRIANEVQL